MNEQVVIRVTSHAAEVVHVHGYDLTSPVANGKAVLPRIA